jgi:hypothetical protein
MSKPVIILFSRQGLTHLFAKIGPILSSEYTIIHIAYCKDEQKILQSYDINPQYTLTEEISKYIIDKDLESIEKILCEHSRGFFNINSAAISDRSLINYSSEEINDLISRYYVFWEKVLLETRAVFIFHEIVTHLYNHIASAMIKKLGGYYFGLVPVFGLDKNNFKFLEFDNGSIDFQLNKNLNDLRFSDKDNEELLKKYRLKLLSRNKNSHIDLKYIKIIKIYLYEKFNYIRKKSKIDKKVDPNNYWLLRNNIASLKFFNKIKMNSFSYHSNKITKNDNFYYFPLHVEPESVLLHWTAGLIDQYSIIEQICRVLPVNTNLVVKEHWVDPYTSKVDRLKELKKIHNLIIVHPKTNATELINNSLGVISINGTALFEAYILNKMAFMLGNNYYSICKSIINVTINDLRKIMKKEVPNQIGDLDFIRKYNNTNYNGNIEQYFNNKIIEDQFDTNNIANAFMSLINKFSLKS